MRRAVHLFMYAFRQSVRITACAHQAKIGGRNIIMAAARHQPLLVRVLF